MMEGSKEWTGASALEIREIVQNIMTDPKKFEAVGMDVREELAIVHECRDRVRARGIRVNIHRIVIVVLIVTILTLLRSFTRFPLAGIAVAITLFACPAVVAGEKRGRVLVKWGFLVSCVSFVDASQGATRQVNAFRDVIIEGVT